MNKVIIHAGLHKTGTSAIQQFLFSNKEQLLKHGYSYPNTDPFHAHHKFASRLLRYRGNELDEGIKDVNRTLYSLSQDIRADSLIISSEMLCEGVNPEYFRDLDKIFSDIEIHFYIRRQDELLESAYNQQIKQSNESRKINEFKPYFTHIYQFLNRYKTKIPNSKVFAHVYDKNLLTNQNIIDDFSSEVLGLKDFSYQIQNTIVNQSLSTVACLILVMAIRAGMEESARTEVLEFLFKYLPLHKFKKYKLLSDKDEYKIFFEEKENNRLLDKEYLGFDYMSKLEPRKNKKYLSFQEAFDIANDLGVVSEFKQRFNLKLSVY